MRLMSLDIGDRRIGVAVSDPEQIVVRGIRVIRRRSLEADLTQIASLVREHEVEKVVVGYPLRSDGTAGEQASKVEAYAEELRQVLEVPVVLWDEGYSTIRAREAMIEAGRKKKERRERIDAVAAAAILQDYLDSLERREERRTPWEETT
jgi:putative Holliday junction resolvase